MIHALQRPARAALLTAALLAACTAHAVPSTEVRITGAVVTPGTYGLADLQALPAVTQTVNFLSGSSSQTHTYTGASLWSTLNAAGIVTDPAVKSDLLDRYVLATGSDGYQTVFSLGELSPSFGNRPDLIAYAETIGGVSAPLTSDGVARITAPGDVKGGRYVSNLVDLDVRSSASTLAGIGGGVSTQFSVSGAVLDPMTFDLAALMALPQTTETFGGHTYVGVSFWELLNSTVGIATDPSVKNDVLGKYVVATGSDGYQSLFSLGELSPDFGDQPDMIAYEMDGASLDSNGFARIVAENDGLKGRWVSNLIGLEVFSATPVPEPATWATLAGGLALVGWAARRRRPAVSGA